MINRFPIARFLGTGSMRLTVALLLATASAPVLAQASGKGDDDPDGPVSVSRPVVQSTAQSPTRDLNAALARLAADPRNVSALFDAADAALKLGDSDAAIGFLARADEVQPGNGRTKALLGKAQLVAENPVSAISSFDEAERAGADTFAMAADRALAYDLVGDNGRAQRWYQVALSRGANDEITRRYAMSLAIAGDRRGAEALLAPLIEKQDRAAWRTRTFAMAVTGGSDEAVAIAYASMPQDLAAGIAPYLRYMPRLTPSQQAAAANFGRFPRAADIGRDDPRVVQYAALNPRAPRMAEAGLIPSGAPLGPSSASTDKPSREKRRRPGRGETTAVATASARPVTATVAPAPVPSQTYTSASPLPSATTPAVPRPTVLSALDVPPGSARPAVPPIRATQPAASRPVSTPTPTTTIAPSASTAARPGFQQDLTAPPAETRTIALGQVAAATTVPPRAATPPPQTVTQPQPSQTASAPQRSTLGTAGSFDLAKVGSTGTPQNAPGTVPPPVAMAAPAPLAVTQTAASAPTPPATTAPTPPAITPPVQTAAAASPPPPRDLASLFKSFAPPEEERSAQVAAVDITRIAPKPTAKATKADARGERPDGPTDVSRIPAKEPEKPSAKEAVKLGKDGKPIKDPKAAAKDAKTKKAAPSHPSRIWVQVLTGGNKDVMDNEWRRLVKEAPEVLRGRKPYLSPWRSNFRLLTGPFESEAEAQEFVTRLKKSGVSSYQWTSPAGQAVDTLSLK
ncbi:SPOR domain-containing protein [Novosphingobium taihuense]|uniref:Flp pilus assembly protein TadD n=1 Tax=Novosphingobium taihuense TaxID=260085 RepID=A0A7W7EVA2_9SPHN|nr:SPOR domain-containing protein [Novosphingobium taihuense]MBB4615242.1 Flp pilus assembly protein TadD [Novosphingobium taihuense]TWH84277.1 Flp pilus assembly protein TadD [Novosphingobium taihuense]